MHLNKATTEVSHAFQTVRCTLRSLKELAKAPVELGGQRVLLPRRSVPTEPGGVNHGPEHQGKRHRRYSGR